MRIGLISFRLEEGNGQSRYAINLSIGLQNIGIETIIFAYSCDEVIKSTLSKSKVNVYSNKMSLSLMDKYLSISDSSYIYSKLYSLVKSVEVCDIYVVVSDELIGISKYRTNYPWIYITQGDMILLYLNAEFLRNNSPISYITSRSFVKRSILHQKRVKQYDYVLSNSKFTSEIMSFLFNVNITDYVYPPVDLQKFKYAVEDVFIMFI